MAPLTLNQDRYVTTPIHDRASDLHYPELMPDAVEEDDDRVRQFGGLIRDTREYRGWSQDELAERAGVSRPTINRYEQAKTKTPDPETARAIFHALKLDPRRIPVLLGYVTEEEMGLPREGPRTFHATTEEVIAILEDPKVDPKAKREWLEYLRWRAQGEATKGRRQAG